MNVPFIKMFVHENYNYLRRKRQNPSRFTRQTSFVPYYTNIFVFTNAQTTEINEIVSKPVSEYLYVESVRPQNWILHSELNLSTGPELELQTDFLI